MQKYQQVMPRDITVNETYIQKILNNRKCVIKITVIKVSFVDGGCRGNEEFATATTTTISASIACVTIITNT